MSIKWEYTPQNGKQEWTSSCTNYKVTEMPPVGISNEPRYFCYKKSGTRYNFLTERITPELAKELCEIVAGRQ